MTTVSEAPPQGLDGLRRRWTMADVAPPALLAVVLVLVWCAALLAMGYAQWSVLRRRVPRSGRWVWVTAGAWLLGVTIPVVALSSVPNGWPGWVHAGIGVIAAVAMGLTVGTLTGRTLERLLRSEQTPLETGVTR